MSRARTLIESKVQELYSIPALPLVSNISDPFADDNVTVELEPEPVNDFEEPSAAYGIEYYYKCLDTGRCFEVYDAVAEYSPYTGSTNIELKKVEVD